MTTEEPPKLSFKEKYLRLKQKYNNLKSQASEHNVDDLLEEIALLKEKATLREAQQSVLTVLAQRDNCKAALEKIVKEKGYFAIDIATAALNDMNDPHKILEITSEYRFEYRMVKKEKKIV